MANTYTLIEQNVLTSNQASVTFSSIPATFTDLVIRASVRHDGTGGNVWFIGAQFNTLTTSIYSDTFMVTDASSIIGTRTSNETPFGTHALTMNQNNYTANIFSNSEMYIPSYTSDKRKVFKTSLINSNYAQTFNYWGFGCGLVRTTEAINQILLKPNGAVGNFVTGSSFYLYGISNA